MPSLRKISLTAVILALTPLAVQAGPHSPTRSAHAGTSGEFPFERIVTFGDSLSDPGNAFVATRDFVVRPFDPIPSAPYAIGFFHFSNGPTWIEWLARHVRRFDSGLPALLRPGLFTDYAIGGARARPPADPVDLDTEIKLFLGDFADSASPDALYAVWIGANDLRDALEDPLNAGAIVTAALQAIGAGLQQLYDAGARSFLVVNQPNLAIAPAINTQPPEVLAAARALSQLYHGGLEQILQGLEAQDAEIVIARLDVFTILDDAVADPASVGLTNVTDSCITPYVIVGAICRHPNQYLFWDYIHPTTQAHRLLSEDAATVLAETFGAFHGVAAAARPFASAR
jgi:phospholipase/lecithinase/hemolysin